MFYVDIRSGNTGHIALVLDMMLFNKVISIVNSLIIMATFYWENIRYHDHKFQVPRIVVFNTIISPCIHTSLEAIDMILPYQMDLCVLELDSSNFLLVSEEFGHPASILTSCTTKK